MSVVLDGTNQYLSSGTSCTGQITYKTMACWFKTADATPASSMWILGDWYHTGGPYYMLIGLNTSGNPYWHIRTATMNHTLNSSVTCSDNTWHCVVGIIGAYRTTEDVKIIVDGTKNAWSSNYLNGSVPSRSSIGAYNGSGNNWNGEIMWSAWWNTNITDAEAYSLCDGASPLTVRPDSLQNFTPLGNLDGDHSLSTVNKRGSFSENNSPTWSDESPAGLIYPRRTIVGLPGSGGPAPIDYTARQFVVKNQKLRIA